MCSGMHIRSPVGWNYESELHDNIITLHFDRHLGNLPCLECIDECYFERERERGEGGGERGGGREKTLRSTIICTPFGRVPPPSNSVVYHNTSPYLVQTLFYYQKET